MTSFLENHESRYKYANIEQKSHFELISSVERIVHFIKLIRVEIERSRYKC